MWQSKVLLSVFYFFLVSSVSTNGTDAGLVSLQSSNLGGLTTTLQPSVVGGSTVTLTYSDDTTTFYVTKTVSGNQFGSSGQAVNDDNVTLFSTTRTTLTSTTTVFEFITLSSSAASSYFSSVAAENRKVKDGNNVGDYASSSFTLTPSYYYGNSTASACIPSTQFVTITETPAPLTQYVTVTPEPVTQTVTVSNYTVSNFTV